MTHVLGNKSGTKYTLDPRAILGQGVEGRVYRSGKNRCVKIFTAPLSDGFVEKINTLINLRKRLPGFAWPVELVVDPTSQRPSGFAMDLVDGENLESMMDAHATGKLSDVSKVQLALQAVRAVALAHAAKGPKIVLGDVIKSGNFVISGTTAVFVDSATLNLFGFRSSNGTVRDSISTTTTPGYVPREVLENPTALPSQSADLFALSVLLFELFFGRPPHEPRPCPAAIGLEPNDAVRKGIYPRWSNNPTFESPAYDDFSIPPAIDDLFRAAFLSTAVRPAASQWLAALEAHLDKLCPKPADPIRFEFPWARLRERTFKWFVEVEPVLILITVLVFLGCGVAWATQATTRAAARIEPVVELPNPSPIKVGPPLFRELFR